MARCDDELLLVHGAVRAAMELGVAGQEAEAGARSARVRERASRHQMISYVWSATQTVATVASATSAGTTTAIGQSSAQATAATRRPRPNALDTRHLTATSANRHNAEPQRRAKAGIE